MIAKKEERVPNAKERKGEDVPALSAPADPSSTVCLRDEPLLLLLLFYKSIQTQPPSPTGLPCEAG